MKERIEAPNHLRHKPIIGVDNYADIDAQFAKSTDVQALSIGFAQYEPTEISGKVWRHTGEKWSRQSEELPLHRIFDLSILAIASFMADNNSNYSLTSLREDIKSPTDLQAIKNFYSLNEHTLRPRLEELNKILTSFLK